MRKNLAFFVFLWGLVFQAQKAGYYQQSVKYTMNIDVDVRKFTYKGEQAIVYKNNSPDELDIIYFHLYWNAFQPHSIMDQEIQNRGKNSDSRLNIGGVSRLSSLLPSERGIQDIKEIRQNGREVKYEIQGTIMKVFLRKAIRPGTSTALSMKWESQIPVQIRRSGRNNAEGIALTMTQWYPKIAEYDYDGWAVFDYISREFHAPFADFDVRISIDKDYIIGAGGTLKNPDEVRGYKTDAKIRYDQNNKVTWHWTAENILDFAWAADPGYIVERFRVPRGSEIFYVYKVSDKTAFWALSKDYITRFFLLMNSKYGAYAYPTYSFIQGGDGGMEYGRCSMILGEAKSLERLVRLMVHEGVHSWFQQMLATNESMRAWMDEGFTTYTQDFIMNILFPPRSSRPNPFVGILTSYQLFVLSGAEQPAGLLADTYDSAKQYNMASYVKGALYLVELGYIMGEEKLSEVLKEYFTDWKMKHPTDRDFMNIAQKISGMDLKWFHHYWINTTKTIDYSIRNVVYTDKETFVTLERKGGIPMPIDLVAVTKDKKHLMYSIPIQLTRKAKERDTYGSFKILPVWSSSCKQYTLSLPLSKNQLDVLLIDPSQRLADISPEDNRWEVK
ncbi:MAG: M1 family metallopeptidase [Bergeyella sp.]|nr:M1 family metallopeptidase [Bergeyella sp.]